MTAQQERLSSAFRASPANVDAEKALLGALMMNNRAYEKVGDFLRAEHFYDGLNGLIFGTIATLIERGQQANPLTLRHVLKDDATFNQAGGMNYIAALAGSVVTIINVSDYGRLIHDMHIRRELIRVADEVAADAFTIAAERGATDVVEAAEAQLYAISSTGGVEDRLKPFDQAMAAALNNAEAAYKNDGALVGVTSGLVDLDHKLGGLHPSDLLILAGRPSMGKTALALTMAYNAAEYFATTENPDDRGRAVAFFSLEMSADQLATRYMAHAARVDSHRIRVGKVSSQEFLQMSAAAQKSGDLPIWIDDTPGISVPQIRSRCRRIANRTKQRGTVKGAALGLIVVDYLQLMSSGFGDRSENRVQEISNITRGLKALAKELNVPVLALSQLSRAVESREDKRPQLADLRESGSIEQDADVVMFMYREQYYLERAEPQQRPEESKERFYERQRHWQDACAQCHNVAEAIIGKQRHGPIGSVRLRFDPATTWFSDLIQPDQSEMRM